MIHPEKDPQKTKQQQKPNTSTNLQKQNKHFRYQKTPRVHMLTDVHIVLSSNYWKIDFHTTKHIRLVTV